MKDKEVVQLKGKTFIYYSNKGLVYRHPTKISWEDRNQPKNKEFIDNLVKKVRDAVSQYHTQNGTNPSRDHVRALLKGETNADRKCLLDCYNEFLGYNKDQIKAGDLQPNSMIDYKSLKPVLIGFEEQSKVKFQLPDINEDFSNQLKEYLLNKRKLSKNTVQKRMNTLNVFIAYCKEQGYLG